MTEKEFNTYVNQYADALYRFIVKNLKHSADAEDVVQTAFEKLWKNRATVQVTKIKTYLFTIAYNTMIDGIRKQKKYDYVSYEVCEQKTYSHLPEQFELKAKLQEALNTLNPEHKSLIMLKDYEGYNYTEIGEITGFNESQVKVYLHRARLQLKNYLVSVHHLI